LNTYAKVSSLVVADVIIADFRAEADRTPDAYSPGYSLSESEIAVLCHEMEKCTELEVLDLTAIKIHRPAAEKLKQTTLVSIKDCTLRVPNKTTTLFLYEQ